MQDQPPTIDQPTESRQLRRRLDKTLTRRNPVSLELSQLISQSSQIAILFIAVVIGVGCLHLGSYVFAPALAGILLGFTIGPLVDYLERRGIPTMLSSGVTVLLLVGTITILILALFDPVQKWSARVPEIGSKFQAEFNNLRAPLDRLRRMEKRVEKAASGDNGITQDSNQPIEVIVKKQGVVSELLTSAPDAFARIALFLGTLYFLLATRSRLRASMLAAFATRRSKLRFARVLRDSEFLLSRYIFTITGVNIVLGMLVAGMTHFMGLPSPLLWGAMAGILNFIPYIGMASMTVVVAGVGLVTFDTLAAALLPALIYLGMNAVEGQFVTPMLLGRNLTLNPLVVFLAIAFWLWLWGPLGAFLAVPLLIVAAATVYHLAPRIVKPEATPSFGKPAANVN